MAIFNAPRITTAQRDSLTLTTSEIVFDTNEKIFYGGDGSTVGGFPIGSGASTSQSIICRNNTGLTIPQFRAVYINGASGNEPTVQLAIANTDPTSSKTFGVTKLPIANNTSGVIVHSGEIDDLNTSAFAEGDLLWLSATTAGALTSVRPSSPDHAVFIGYIIRSHPTLGKIIVTIQNGLEIGELHDVEISLVADNQVLKYDAPNLLWKNETLVKSDVGLSNVDNTSDINKQISTATQTALDNKVDKVVGKGLSTEDYTTAEKSKLAGIASGATANQTDAYLLDRTNHTGTQAPSTIVQDALNRFTNDDAISRLQNTSGTNTGDQTLQQVYNLSTTPEILTDSTRGAVSLKRGSAADSDSVLEVLNGSGAVKASIDGLGSINGEVVKVNIGSAAAPSLTFTGDTNTGFFGTGSDVVAIATNGIERMRVSSTGNVGIGTSSPASTLSGPVSNPFTIASSLPVQAASTVAGNNLVLAASSAVAGSSTPGSAAGGNVTISAGNAAMLTTGTGAGGSVTITGGKPQTSSGSASAGDVNIFGGDGNTVLGNRVDGGGSVNIIGGYTNGPGGSVYISGASGLSHTGGGGKVTVTTGNGFTNQSTGDLIFSTGDVATNTKIPGNITIRAGRANYSSNQTGQPYGYSGSISILTQAAATEIGASSTAKNAGGISVALGNGGASSGATLGTGGNGGVFTLAGGAGGAASGSGGTHLGGNGSGLTVTSGDGGNATGISGNRTGGNSGSIALQTGAAGTGATANGTIGNLTLQATRGNVGVGTSTPNSKLHNTGSDAMAYTSTSSNLVLSEHYVVAVSATATITLPSAIGIAGRVYKIKSMFSGTVTIATTSSQTIDDASPVSITTQYQVITVMSDGANWINI